MNMTGRIQERIAEPYRRMMRFVVAAIALAVAALIIAIGGGRHAR